MHAEAYLFRTGHSASRSDPQILNQSFHPSAFLDSLVARSYAYLATAVDTDLRVNDGGRTSCSLLDSFGWASAANSGRTTDHTVPVAA